MNWRRSSTWWSAAGCPWRSPAGATTTSRLGGTVHGPHRRRRGSQRVRGPEPPCPSKAPGAGRAGQAGEPARLGRAKRSRTGARPRSRRPCAWRSGPHHHRPGLEPPRRPRADGGALDRADAAENSAFRQDRRSARTRGRPTREGSRRLELGGLAGAIDRRTWDHVRAVLLNPERLTLGNTPTKYLLMGLIFCGVCEGRMFSRPRDDHTKRYVCAGRRPGHQLTIVAQPVDDLVARRVLDLLTTPAFRDAVLAQSAPADDGSLGRRWRRWDQRKAACRPSTTSSTCEAPSASAGTARSGRGWSARWSAFTARSQ